MPDMTMSQAAKWAGVTRATMHKAIKNGRLSAVKDAAGMYQINPAELERVYRHKPVADIPIRNPDVSESNKATIAADRAMAELLASKHAQIDLLREALAEARITIADARAERDKATAAAAEAMATVRRLTDQRSADIPPGRPQTVAEGRAAPDVVITPPPPPKAAPEQREPLAEAIERISAIPEPAPAPQPAPEPPRGWLARLFGR